MASKSREAHKLNHGRLRPRSKHVEPAYNSRAPIEESIDTPTRLSHVSNNLLSLLEMQSLLPTNLRGGVLDAWFVI